MPDALALAPAPAAPTVTRDQLDLARRTVAKDATDAEFELFLYDCARRHVHPLDRLLHFTKRSRRYTPITSIDFLRGRAHDTGEMAGSDDVVFDKDARTATVTVHRLTHGVRYAYTATARYAEYVPAPGQDHMWKRMPHARAPQGVPATARRAVRQGRTRAGAPGFYDRGDVDRGPVRAAAGDDVAARGRPRRRCPR
jgi:hypothetical protein